MLRVNAYFCIPRHLDIAPGWVGEVHILQLDATLGLERLFASTRIGIDFGLLHTESCMRTRQLSNVQHGHPVDDLEHAGGGAASCIHKRYLWAGATEHKRAARGREQHDEYAAAVDLAARDQSAAVPVA